MKRCPFCAEDIQDEAVKCRFCNEFLDGRPRQAVTPRRWYYQDVVVIAALSLVSVLALPLVWVNPHYSRRMRWVITGITVVVTWALFSVTPMILRSLGEYSRAVI